jgi:hypothetical protein
MSYIDYMVWRNNYTTTSEKRLKENQEHKTL